MPGIEHVSPRPEVEVCTQVGYFYIFFLVLA